MPLSHLNKLFCILLPFHLVETRHFLQPNITLLFDSTTHDNLLRNCSCASEVRSCDEALANLLCSCGSVCRSSLAPGSLEAKNLMIWAHQPWMLKELLNGSRVLELQLSLCRPASLLGPAEYISIVDLRKLQISISGVTSHKGEKVLNLGLNVQNGSSSVAFLDMWSLNNHLKAYSVVGPPLQMLKQHFPNLAQANIQMKDVDEMHKPSILTFIY
ncbi:polycystin-1-interacting protein 1-like [Trichomycterus rosablanca]|uniref:polycystin-1-interacting protein 1-like n=1 Tax=Trichomycterus rosablanca TaxID=2290929 RepID=UPI002F3590E2